MQQILPKRDARVVFVFEGDAAFCGDYSHGKAEFAGAFCDRAFFLGFELAFVTAPLGKTQKDAQ